jgi:hypothetical protein
MSSLYNPISFICYFSPFALNNASDSLYVNSMSTYTKGIAICSENASIFHILFSNFLENIE